MNAVIECSRCPSCGDARVVPILPHGARVDSTLDLVFERERASELSEVDLSPFLSPEFLICENCALIFMKLRSTPESAASYYPQLFHIIETPLPFDELPIPERFLRRRTLIAQRLIEVLADGGYLTGVESALHVRCNMGEVLKILRDEYGLSEIYGLEYLPSLIRHAKEVFGLKNVERMVVPEFNNPFPRKQFDLIFCNEPFGHAHDPGLVVEELKKLLNEDGLIVLYNEKDHSRVLDSNKLFPHGMNFFHKQLYTRKSLRSFLELSGFEVLSLPHPAIGKATSSKNTKLLYLLRPDGGTTPMLPSDEVAAMKKNFRRWWSSHKWYKRRKRLLSAFQGRRMVAGGGGEARR
jgi:SAM-dependent methyltransferase